VPIGFFDTGAQNQHPVLDGNVWWHADSDLIDDGSNDLDASDVIGHGTSVAQLVVGRPRDQFAGGIAPEAALHVFRIIPDEPVPGNPFGQPDVGAGLSMLEEGLAFAQNYLRALNFSWDGDFSWEDQQTTDRLVEAFHTYIDLPAPGTTPYQDGLVIFAAGDGGSANPSQMAALPNANGGDSLRGNWLTVAAVETSDPTRLASYSNACGIAMDYCLVAPGDVVVTGKDDTSETVTYWSVGSSQMASPQVLAAAALVFEAYPYLSGAQVGQVLLAGARDLGEPGVDPVFGHGLLDVGKSLLGPSRLDWGDMVVNLGGSQGTYWQNEIAGDGGLVVDGNGVWSSLTLYGRNVFTGDVRVGNRANLIIANDMAASIHIETEGSVQLFEGVVGGDIQVGQGAALYWGNNGSMPSLTINGDIANDGYLAVGPYPNATLGGSYTQGPDGTLTVYLGTDPLHFSGSAQLAGGLDIGGLAPGYVAHGQTEILIADGGVTGQFGAMSWRSGLLLEATFGYGTDRVWLDVTRADVVATAASLSGITPASLGAATRVEDAFEQIDVGARTTGGGTERNRPMREGFLALAGELQRISDPDSLKSSLRSLSGEVHAAAATATYDTLDQGRRALSTRFDALASGVDRVGGWLRGLDGSASLGSGVDAQVEGWLAGHDVALDGRAVAGLAFGESRTDSRVEGLTDRSRERQTQAQAYLGRQWNQGYVMGQFGIGQWQRQIDRELLLGANRYGLHSDYDGDFAVAGLETGYRFDGRAGTLVPYLGAEHARVRSDGFHEEGAAGFGLRTMAATSSRTQAIAGLRTDRDWRRISVSGYAEWQQTLASDGLAVSASFVGVDAWSPLAASDPALSGGMFGLSAKAWLSPQSALSFGYDQRFGPRGDAGLVSVRYAVGF